MKHALLLFALVATVSAQDYAGEYLIVDKPTVVLRYGPPSKDWPDMADWTFLWADCQGSLGAVMALRYSQDMVTWETAQPSAPLRTRQMSIPVAAQSPDGAFVNLLAPDVPSFVPSMSFMPSMTFALALFPPAPSTPLVVRQPLESIVVDLTQGSMGDLRTELTLGSPKYRSSAVETKVWFGTVMASNCLRVYIHADNGATVKVDGNEELSEFGQQTSWYDIDGSTDFVTMLQDGPHEVQVNYSNSDTGGGTDPDGVSLVLVCAASAAAVSPTGPSQMYWYGSPYTSVWTYALSTFASSVQWTCSSNLLIVSENDTLQTVTVKPHRASEYPLADWVTAVYRLPCSSVTVTGSTPVTVRYPTALNATGHGSTWTYGLATADINFQILDQFAQPWLDVCYATCTEQDSNGTASSGVIGGFPTNLVVSATGRWIDTWRWNTPVNTVNFTRTRERFIHKLPDQRGRSFLKTITYHCDPVSHATIKE